MYDIIYMWNLTKYDQLVYITKKKQTHRHTEETSGYEWGVGRNNIGDGEQEVQSTVRWAQGCIVQHREYRQYFVITVNGK